MLRPCMRLHGSWHSGHLARTLGLDGPLQALRAPKDGMPCPRNARAQSEPACCPARRPRSEEKLPVPLEVQRLSVPGAGLIAPHVAALLQRV